MNKISNSLRTVVRWATVAVFGTILSFEAVAKTKTIQKMTTPDFAYPQTVEKNADAKLRNAMTSGNWVAAIEATIQSVTAKNIVNHKNATAGIAKIDSVAASAPAEWQPVFLLIKGQMLGAIYDDIRWQADNRKLDLDSVPDNPYEWSRDIFADRTYTLCKEIIEKGTANDTPLQEWKGFLENTQDAFACGMTTGEWLTLQCFQLLSQYSDTTKDIIPFFSTTSEPITPTQKCSSLRDNAIDILIANAKQLNQHILYAKALSDKAFTLPYSMRMKSLLNAFDKTKGTEGEQLILCSLRDYTWERGENDSQSAFPYSKREYMNLVEKSLESYPKGMYANALRNILNDMSQPSADIQFDSQYLSSTSIEMDVTLSNSNETWLLIYDYAPYANASTAPRTSEMVSRCRLVKAVKATVEGSIPFTSKTVAEIGKLPKGTYVVVPSATADGKGLYEDIKNNRWRQPFTVSDISAMTLQYPDAKTRVFVVDGSNGHPIEGATVKFYTVSSYNKPRTLAKTLTTDKEGSATVTLEKFEFEASYNGSVWKSQSRHFNSTFRRDTTVFMKVQVLTDRALYHPGDSVKAVAIAYSSQGQNLNLSKDMQFELQLRDANGKEVTKAELTTDYLGRATAEFKLPDQGLLGNWQLSAYGEGKKWLGNASIEVADYVAPTFFITADEKEEEVNPGATMVLKGQVLTYSGMPVGGADVKYQVRYTPPMRWFKPSGATFDSSVTADEEGRYVIELPTANLKGTQFERGVFTVNISATSPSGETQNGPTQRFALGKEYTLQPVQYSKDLNITDSIPSISFNLTDMLGRKVKNTIAYKLINIITKETVAQGEFMAPNLVLPSKAYASAVYEIEASLKENPEVKCTSRVTLWRDSDKSAPQGTSLWLPVRNMTAPKGAKKVDITIGSGVPDRWIPIVVSCDGKIMDMKWLHVEKDNLSIPVDAPQGKYPYNVGINYISDLKEEFAVVSINSSESQDRLEVKSESFRNKITAGDKENWKFRFYKQTGDAKGIAAMAVMTDASLNAIVPFKWNFIPFMRSQQSIFLMTMSNRGTRNIHSTFKIPKYLASKEITLPIINDYGQSWGLGGGMYYSAGVAYVNDVKDEAFYAVQESTAAPLMMKNSTSMKVRGMGAMKTAATADYAVMVEEESEEAPMDSAAEDGGEANQEKGDLRQTECPVAFFMPDLISDKDGIVSIDFTVPNFNTTWALQVMGYDREVQVASTQLEAVASKPIMVSTHSPRFVRTGDIITLTATVFNNSDETSSPKCRIELVDLLTGRIIATDDFAAEAIAPMGNRLITMKWVVPSGISTVGFRAYGETDSHRDGEQALLPVLPASSPVVESTQFWLAPGQESQSVVLPKFNETDQVTLQYCDNPAWYCLTALPAITTPDSKSVTSKVKALFGNVVAYNLVSSNPQLKTGLETMLSDKNSEFAALKSNLEKDGNLKIVQLNNTPWVNNAESETLRMSNLISLLNDEEAQKTISGILEDVKGLQQPDGGWSWCPGMESSSYITRDVLRHFSMIERNGAMKYVEGAEAMIKSGIGYVDKEIVKDYHKYHKKGESLSYLLDWLYVRSGFPKSFVPKGANSNEMNSIASIALKDITREWKDMEIGSKAKAAMLLQRSGDPKTASAILESLRQYASESPEKGMWFANLNSGWHGYSALQATTLVLQAFAEIQPANKIVDSLRQWLVLGRQYEDWGKNSGTVETVNAILTSGNEWTTASTVPEFRIKGKELVLPETAKLTGAFTMTLNAKEASKKELTVKRTGKGPAWGGVISQYVTPIKEVKPADVPDLSISKRIVALVEGENGELTPKEGITLKKGMKVRVTLTINAGRDMDYVAVTDERSACLEPIDQLSGYRRSDGVGFYREVRDSQTNLFFGWLPKGDHVVSYDCRVSQEGEFSCGIATVQSQYSPMTTAHSAGELLKAE